MRSNRPRLGGPKVRMATAFISTDCHPHMALTVLRIDNGDCILRGYSDFEFPSVLRAADSTTHGPRRTPDSRRCIRAKAILKPCRQLG